MVLVLVLPDLIRLQLLLLEFCAALHPGQALYKSDSSVSVRL